MHVVRKCVRVIPSKSLFRYTVINKLETAFNNSGIDFLFVLFLIKNCKYIWIEQMAASTLFLQVLA